MTDYNQINEDLINTTIENKNMKGLLSERARIILSNLVSHHGTRAYKAKTLTIAYFLEGYNAHKEDLTN